MKKLFLAALILVVVAVACWFLIPERKSPPPTWVALPDGTKMRLLAVTYGTNHVIGSRLARMTAHAPPMAQSVLIRLLGQRAVPLQQRGTSVSKIMVWMDHQTNGPAGSSSVSHFEAVLGDTNQFISGSGAWISSPLFSPGVEALEFDVLPRRSPEITLNIFQHDNSGKTSLCGKLTFQNPQFRDYPVWHPEPLPAIKRTKEMEVTLRAVETGYDGNMMTAHAQRGGGTKVTYGTNVLDGRNHTAVDLSIKPLGDTNVVWQVANLEISDATGNHARDSSMNWGGNGAGFIFMPSLWPSESAWRLKLSLKRTKGFLPEQILVFKNVPLGALDQTNTVAWSTNIGGQVITLASLCRHAPHTNNSYSSRDLSSVRFTHGTLPPDLVLDLTEVGFNTGKTNESVGAESTADYHVYQFRDFPPNAETADFELVLQKLQPIEFTAKPGLPKTMVDKGD